MRYDCCMRIVLGISVALILIAIPFVSFGQSTDAQIQALLQQILQLQQVLAQLRSAPVITPTPTIVNPTVGNFGTCPILGRDLRPGMSGGDVANLQSFLAGDVTIYPEATISAYYGGLTQAAVQRFQTRYGIVSYGSPDTTGYGAVGPATRARIASVCGGSRPPIIQTPLPTPSPYPSIGGCFVGNTSIANGSSITMYSIAAAPLGTSCSQFRQTRTCAGGYLSGNSTFQYSTCLEHSQSSCAVSGTNIPNGTTQTLFSRTSVDQDDSCNDYRQERTCVNGTLSGSSSYRYLDCSVDKPDSCRLDGVTVSDGTSRTFYAQKVVSGTATCSSVSQTRTCDDGDLSGDSEYEYASCTAGACLIEGGTTITNGSSTKLYFAQNIPSNEQCSSYSQTRTCTSGVLSGSDAYKYPSCSPVASGSCVVDNVIVSNGSSRTFYSASAAPTGQTCSSVAQSRTCTNGALNGSNTYNRSSCIDNQSCALNGVIVAHGGSATFYNASIVPFGSTCSSAAQTRTCSNGYLSGNTSYQYASCSVSPPTSALSNQLASALVALQGALTRILELLR